MAKAPEDANIDRNCVCGQVRNSIHIDFDGFVMPCPAMSFNEAGKSHFVRIFDKSLKELLNEGAYMNIINTRLADYFKKNPLCAACEYKNRCSSGCRGNAMATVTYWASIKLLVCFSRADIMTKWLSLAKNWIWNGWELKLWRLKNILNIVMKYRSFYRAKNILWIGKRRQGMHRTVEILLSKGFGVRTTENWVWNPLGVSREAFSLKKFLNELMKQFASV